MKKKLLVTTLFFALIGTMSAIIPNNVASTKAEDIGTELGKYWMSVSAASSTKSHESQSIEISFATGYSSFSTEKSTTISGTKTTRGAAITYSKDIDAADAADFDAFYYDGKDGAPAFNKMTNEELAELADLYRANYKSSSVVPSIYEAVIKNIDSRDEKNTVCIIPKVIYRSDVGNDPYVADASSLTLEEKSTPIFTTSNGDKVYLHDDVIFFGFNPSSISSNALEKAGTERFKEIYIPKNIKTIYADSFFHEGIQPLDDCIFRLEATKEEIDNPENGYKYAAGCFGSNEVSYGYEKFDDYYKKDIDGSSLKEYNQTKNKRKEIRNTTAPSFGTGKEYDYNEDPLMVKQNNYFVGYYPKETSEQKPLIAKFDVLSNTDSSLIGTITYTLPAPETGTYYSVGNEIYKLKTSINLDIIYDGLLVDKGGQTVVFDSNSMTINPRSVILYNIYHAVLDADSSYKPHIDPTAPNPTYCGPLYCKSADKGGNLRISFEETISIDSFLSIGFEGLTSFSGFTAINLSFKKTDKDIYKKINPSSYKTYKSKIDSGEIYIRYRVDSLKQAYLKITLKTNTIPFEVPIETPVKQFLLDKDVTNASFLLNNAKVGHGFNMNNIEKVDMIGFYISIDLARKTSGPIGRTAVSTRFGAVNIVPSTLNCKKNNADLFAIIFMCSYLAVFVIVAAVLYFYLREKYKNDEFRRMNTKKYIKKSALTFLCLGIVIVEILAIVFRTTLFKNAIVVFNPVDAYIIGFGVASILVIGYFIKFAVAQGKARKARNMAKKLKLDEDVAQDGTN